MGKNWKLPYTLTTGLKLILINMLYIIKLVTKNNNILNVYSTNNIDQAIQKEFELIKIYGKENVWLVDIMQEISVG